MTNDTSTLNGALQELGETMAANLTAKGVTASASDGLTTLAGKILDITGGGGGVPCYHVEFTNNSLSYADYSFTASSQVAVLEVYLQYQYEPFSGDVTITDGTNTYTVTTNAQGIGKLTAPVTANSTTFTATYTNTSDTHTVTKSTFLFLDACNSSSNLSHYGSSVQIYKSSSGNPACSLSYSSSMNAYDLHSTNSSTSYYSMIPITDLNGKTDYIFEFDVYCNASKSSNDVGVYVDNSGDTTSVGYGTTINIYNARIYGRGFLPATSYSRNNIQFDSGVLKAQHWYTIKMKVTDTRFDVELWDGETLLTSFGYAQAVSNKQLGLMQRGGSAANTTNYIRNIKARSIAT